MGIKGSLDESAIGRHGYNRKGINITRGQGKGYSTIKTAIYKSLTHLNIGIASNWRFNSPDAGLSIRINEISQISTCTLMVEVTSCC